MSSNAGRLSESCTNFRFQVKCPSPCRRFTQDSFLSVPCPLTWSRSTPTRREASCLQVWTGAAGPTQPGEARGRGPQPRTRTVCSQFRALCFLLVFLTLSSFGKNRMGLCSKPFKSIWKIQLPMWLSRSSWHKMKSDAGSLVWGGATTCPRSAGSGLPGERSEWPRAQGPGWFFRAGSSQWPAPGAAAASKGKPCCW